MKPIIAIFAASVLLLAGCSSNKGSAELYVPPPVVTDAVYYDSHNHNYVYITGEFFQLDGDTPLDVVTSFNGARWVPAIKIFHASAREYKVSLPYGPEYPEVWVRVYGMNHEYSEPFRVHFYPGVRQS